MQVPTLVLIGGRDVQIDVHADGGPLQETAAGMTNVTFAFPPNANHVFKEDTRDPAEVAASPGNGYNEPGAHLDPESLETILAWVRRDSGFHGVFGLTTPGDNAVDASRVMHGRPGALRLEGTSLGCCESTSSPSAEPLTDPVVRSPLDGGSLGGPPGSAVRLTERGHGQSS